MQFYTFQKDESFISVAQAATQTTPESERVSFVGSSKIKNRPSHKSWSSPKNATTDSPDSCDSKDSVADLTSQEFK